MEAGTFLGKLSTQESSGSFKKEVKELDMFFDFSDEESKLEEEFEIFYLFDTNLELFSLYERILRFYMSENYGMDTFPNIIFKLAEKKGYDVEYILIHVPYIHSSYVKVLLDHWKQQNGNSS